MHRPGNRLPPERTDVAEKLIEVSAPGRGRTHYGRHEGDKLVTLCGALKNSKVEKTPYHYAADCAKCIRLAKEK